MDEEDYGEVPDFDSVLNASEQQGTAKLQTPPVTASRTTNKIQQPKPQVIANRSARSAILVSARQKGNPILNHVRLLPWEYADIPADYVLGETTCALFLSLKYHRLHPEYVYSRIKLLGTKYTLRILLIMVDIPNHEDSLKELSKTSIVNNLTLILCWSAAEAGHYLELFKSSEKAPPTAIRSQQAQSYKDSLVEFITTPRSINKSDAASLISTFGSLQAAINAQPEQISSVPGWGERKVGQWTDAIKEDFKTHNASRMAAVAKSGARQPRAQNPTRTNEQSLDDLFENPISQAEPAVSDPSLNDEMVIDDFGTRHGTGEADNAREDGNEGIMAALAKLREVED